MRKPEKPQPKKQNKKGNFHFLQTSRRSGASHNIQQHSYFTMGVALNMSPRAEAPTQEMGRTKEYLRNILTEATQIVEESTFDVDENDVSESYSSSSSSSSSRSCGPQRAIHFSPDIEYHEIICLEDYTEKELRKCWYSPEEKDKMNRNKDKVVARLEAGKPAKRDMTYQGLHCWTTAGGQALDESIALVVNSVMDEQDRQWAANQDDFERIAEISASVTSHSARAALSTGLSDEMEARLAWEYPGDDISMASEHSDDLDDIDEAPAVSRRNLFSVVPPTLTRRSSKVQQFARMGVTPPPPPAPKKTKESSSKSKSKKSKKSKKSSEKSRRKATLDPPAPLERTHSQDGTDVLIKMRSVSRNMAVL